MNVTPSKRVSSVALCFALIAFTIPIEAGALTFYQDQQAAPPSAPSTACVRLSGTRRANDH